MKAYMVLNPQSSADGVLMQQTRLILPISLLDCMMLLVLVACTRPAAKKDTALLGFCSRVCLLGVGE